MRSALLFAVYLLGASALAVWSVVNDLQHVGLLVFGVGAMAGAAAAARDGGRDG